MSSRQLVKEVLAPRVHRDPCDQLTDTYVRDLATRPVWIVLAFITLAAMVARLWEIL